MRAALLASTLALFSPGPAMAAAPSSPLQAYVRAAGGVVVAYPTHWRAVVASAGTVIGIAGPATGGVRPAASILVARGREDMRFLMASAARGIERTGKARLLGEQRLGASRWVRYYLRQGGRDGEYVVVGVAQGGGWVATMVAVDAASDPALRVRAAIFERILAELQMPG